MKLITKTIVIALFILTGFFTGANSNSANASVSTFASEVKSSDWLLFSRVVEPDGDVFIYVFTEGGVFVTKYEEL